MSLRTRSHVALLLPTLALVFATACSGAAATPSPVPTRSPAPTRTPHTSTVPATLVGTTWQADIQNTDASAGVWTIAFTSHDLLATNPSPDAVSFPVGIANVTADEIDFMTPQDCQAGDPQPDATYTYAIVNNQLTFTLLQDKCRDRREMLTAMPWDQQP